jgi:FKBP-type peptidyl-prolyl cis-trans isomerase 2
MIKKGDFVELNYVGKLKDDNVVFDTTVLDVAKTMPNYNPKYNYATVIVCIGETHLITGLEHSLIGKTPGRYTFDIKAENGFGKKDAKLLKLLPLKLFTKEKIQPFVGLDVNIDNQVGIIRSVSGGRVIVDFNHPLAGKELVYDVEVKRIVTDPLEQVKSLLSMIHVPFNNIDIMDKKAVITMSAKLPEELTKGMADHIKKLVGLDSVEFAESKSDNKHAEHNHDHHDHDHHEHKHN